MRRQYSMVGIWFVFMVVLVLTGCTPAQMVNPQSIDNTLVHADTQFTGAVRTATDLLRAGVMDEGDAERANDIIQEGNRTLDSAWAAVCRFDKTEDIEPIENCERDPDLALTLARTLNTLSFRLLQHNQEVQ